MFVIYAWLISYFIIHVRATCDTPYRECPSDEVWHCQYDAETEYQVEFCAKAVKCHEGGRAVLHKETKSVSCEVCAEDMFQPEGKRSNDFTQPNCDDRVTPCNERQLVCEKATATENNKCACNYTAGYKPKQTSGCNCFSQDSTCECEKGTCEEGEILSPDYNCSSSKISGATTTSNKGLIIGLSVGSVIFLLGVTVLILCCYKHRKSLNCKGKKKDGNGNNETDVKQPLQTSGIEMGSNVTDNTEAKQPLTSQHPDSEMDKTDGEANIYKTDNNATPSDDPNSSKKSNGESNTEPKPPIGNTTTVEVSKKAHVGQANAASSVHGGQGNTILTDCTVHVYPDKSETAPLVDHNNL